MLACFRAPAGGSLKRSAPLSLSNGLGMATQKGNIPKGFAFEAATHH
jgi:hypothetical protein